MRDMLQDSIYRILEEQVTPALLQSAEGGQWPGALFDLLDEGGFTRAVAPERAGGVGASWSDVFPIVFASGRFALPAPVTDSLAACWLLDQCGIQVPAGSLSLGECGAETRLARQGSGWQFNGALPQVAWGRAVEHVVTCVRDDNGWRVVLLDRASAQVQPDGNLAREPRDHLLFSAVAPLATAPWPAEAAQNPLRLYGAMMRAGQLAGAMDRALQLSVTYANDRVQFGKPIGKFQAIQQQLALLASESASVSAAAEYAFGMAAQGRPDFAVACAKQRASEVAGKAAAIAHAVHGAIGFTYEHSLHYLTRRLWAWRSEFGTHAYWSAELGRQIGRGGGAALWPTITSESVTAD